MHPTRNLPSCATCAHFAFGHGGRCNHPDAPVDMVTGAPCMPAAQMRSVVAAPSYSVPKTCGVDGHLHEIDPGLVKLAQAGELPPGIRVDVPEGIRPPNMPSPRPVAPATPWSLTGALRNLRYRGQ